MSEDDLRCEAEDAAKTFPAPELPYLPPMPESYRPPIGMIGCGGISEFHLAAYAKMGLNVLALCDLVESKARKKGQKHFPDAAITTDYREILARDDVEVVDIATHPVDRAPLIEAALRAGKHVLSQKPFVIDLEVGRRFAELAAEKGVKLAVNQNGRWAPHFSWMRHAIAEGLVGEVQAAHLAVHWNHGWTAGTVFDEGPHLILYDFSIHWFDMLRCLIPGKTPRRVFATEAFAPQQKNRSPLLAQTIIQYDDAQASLVFDANTLLGASDETCIVGTTGALRSEGPDLNHQRVRLITDQGVATPEFEGDWFTNGFVGTMADLLCAIEQNREPLSSAADNIKSLELCFAALASARTGEPVTPGTVNGLAPA